MVDFYHPVDTREVYQSNSEILNLSYRIHYNQNISREKFEVHNSFAAPEKLVKKVNETVQYKVNQALLLEDAMELKFLRGVPEDRIATGLGQDITEGTIELHHVYGVPYIAGSSIKGAVRGWFLEAFCEGEEENLENDPIGSWGFGTKNQKGLIQFHDVFLHSELSFEKMIQNVHFGKYYSGKMEGASDKQGVVPFNYLACKVKEALFTLSIPKKLPKDCPVKSDQLIQFAESWLTHAMEEMGIGSKKTYNFGRFSSFQDVTAPLREEREVQLSLLRQKEEAERKRKAEEQAKNEEQERLESMTEAERLQYEISKLSNSSEDLQKSKADLYNRVIESKDKTAAEKLRDYWITNKEWVPNKKEKKKQEKKSNKIEAIINQTD